MELKQVRFYEGSYANFWLLSPEQDNTLNKIEVYIQGNEQRPQERWLSFAYDIFNNHWISVVDLARKRLRVWAEHTDKDYEIESIYFGDYPYGQGQDVQHGFKLTLKTAGIDCEDAYGKFTINFNQNMWPIGYEFTIA